MGDDPFIVKSTPHVEVAEEATSSIMAPCHAAIMVDHANEAVPAVSNFEITKRTRDMLFILCVMVLGDTLEPLHMHSQHWWRFDDCMNMPAVCTSFALRALPVFNGSIEKTV